MARAYHVTRQDHEFERRLSGLDERRVAGIPGPNRSADDADETPDADAEEDDDLDDEDLDDDDEFEDDDDSDEETAEDEGEEPV